MPSYSQQPHNERLVVGIAGRIGSGKTSVGKYLGSKYGFQYVRYSQVLSNWRGSDSEGKTYLQEIGWDVMSGGMQTDLNERLIAQITADKDVAVDGLRHPIDYEAQRNSFLSSFHLLYIDSTSEDRWQRLQGHGRYVDFDTFERADLHPVEQQIEWLRAHAELVIENEGSLQNLFGAVDTAIRRFRKEDHG